jgi:type VI protein secretion system component VasF
MWWIIGVIAVVVLVVALIVRSHLQDIDDDY